MINTALVYMLGVKVMYIEIRGGFCLFLTFQLAYMDKLSRQCPVKTRGEWIKFRFGDRRDGILLRTLIAFAWMMNGFLAVTYFAVGGGEFFTEFVHIPHWLGLPSEFWAALFLMIIAILYTIVSGFTTVVYTDVYQSLFIFASLHPDKSQHSSGGDEHTMLEISYSRSSWVSVILVTSLHLPDEASYSMYNSFNLMLGMYLLLQAMRSASSPGGSGLQTVLATKAEKEVHSQTFLVMALLALRWAFSGGVVVMATRYTIDNTGFFMDLECID